MKATAAVKIPTPTQNQAGILQSDARRLILRAGRRGGKTISAALFAAEAFMEGRRVLYATPTADQLQSWWREVKRAFFLPVDSGLLRKNESEHTIGRELAEARLRGKTAWNADTLRGDYADVLILDEAQLIDPAAWEEVGAPMLLDNDGIALIIYTPPDPRRKNPGYEFCRRLYKRGQDVEEPDWESFHWGSAENPHISQRALRRLSRDMIEEHYQREIEAKDTDHIPDALWTRELLAETRVTKMPSDIERISIGVDPPGGATECGIVGAARSNGDLYIFADRSLQSTPERWRSAVVSLAIEAEADIICGESNFGGDMVESLLRDSINETPARYKNVRASRGKAIRAEPVVARFERGEAHLVGAFADLEDELCTWVPGSNMPSPNRLDAMVWACAELWETSTAGEVW